MGGSDAGMPVPHLPWADLACPRGGSESSLQASSEAYIPAHRLGESLTSWSNEQGAEPEAQSGRPCKGLARQATPCPPARKPNLMNYQALLLEDDVVKGNGLAVLTSPVREPRTLSGAQPELATPLQPVPQDFGSCNHDAAGGQAQGAAGTPQSKGRQPFAPNLAALAALYEEEEEDEEDEEDEDEASDEVRTIMKKLQQREPGAPPVVVDVGGLSATTAGRFAAELAHGMVQQQKRERRTKQLQQALQAFYQQCNPVSVQQQARVEVNALMQLVAQASQLLMRHGVNVAEHLVAAGNATEGAGSQASGACAAGAGTGAALGLQRCSSLPRHLAAALSNVKYNMPAPATTASASQQPKVPKQPAQPAAAAAAAAATPAAAAGTAAIGPAPQRQNSLGVALAKLVSMPSFSAVDWAAFCEQTGGMDTEFKLHDAPLFDGPAQLPGGHSAATPMQLMQDSTTSRVGSSSAIPEHPTDCPPHADTPDMVTQLPELPSADKGGDSRGCKATHDQHRQAVLYAQPQMEYEAPELDSAEFQMAMELCAALAGQGSPVVASPLPTPPPPPPPACPAPAVATAVTRSGLLQQGIMAPNTFHHPMSTCDHHVLNSFTDLPGDGHVVVTANGHAPGGLSQGMDWLERTDSIFKFASMNMADVAEEVAAELTAGVVPTFEEVMVPVAVMDADGSGDEPCAAAQHASCNFSGHRGAPSGFLQSTGHGSFLVERPPVDAIATITRTAALAKDGGITALPPMAPGSAKTTASTSRDCSNDGSGGSTSGINSDLGGSEGGNADAMEEDDQAQDEDNNGNVTAEPDAVSEGTNTDGEENDDDDEDEPFVIRPHGPYSKRHITKAMLREHFDKPISQAAAALGIGVTVLKKYCRRFKVVRWPYRKLRSMDKLIDSVGEFCSDPSMIQMVLAELLAFRKQILNDPSIDLEARVKKLRQANFKHEYRQRLSDDAADDGTTRRRKRAPPASRQRHADTSAKTHKREKPLHELV